MTFTLICGASTKERDAYVFENFHGAIHGYGHARKEDVPNVKRMMDARRARHVLDEKIRRLEDFAVYGEFLDRHERRRIIHKLPKDCSKTCIFFGTEAVDEEKVKAEGWDEVIIVGESISKTEV